MVSNLHINYIEFTDCAYLAVESSISTAYDRPKRPSLFYHYTPKLKEIYDSGCLWSISLDEQKDCSELIHGLQWLNDRLRLSMEATAGEFTRTGLQLIPELVDKRRKWMFITCFCANFGSSNHQMIYGADCLKLTDHELVKLRCRDPNASRWLQPVIYSEDVQKVITFQAIDRLVECLERQSVHEPMQNADYWLAANCAQDMASILLQLLSGFKRPEYKDENEWRLVFCPRLVLGHTAPSSLDEDFQVAIKNQPRRHIELSPLNLDHSTF